jgi:hypothetical protein
MLAGRVSGAPDKDKRVSATPATNIVRESPASDQASQEAARYLIPPTPRSCSASLSITTPLYRRTVSQTLRLALRESGAAAHFRELRTPEVRRMILPRLSEKGLSNAPKVDSDVMRRPKWVETSLLGDL